MTMVGEAAADTVPITSKQQLGSLCEECDLNPSKYRCPGCSLRTCSLPCVNSHKKRTACTGKRNQTRFVPLSQFDDNVLLSDFNLLEDVKKVAESAQRMRIKMGGYPQFRLPAHLKGLRNAAARRGIKLLLLPAGMSKRNKNQSRYNQRKKSISWTIEWRFHSTDVVLHDHGVHESAKLCSVIEKHLKPGPWNHKLKKFCEEGVNNLKFFIRKYPKGPKSPFRELDINAPLEKLLAKTVILEYPVIHVFLPSHSFDFEVIRDIKPPHSIEPDLKRSNQDNSPSPRGVPFKEEEIEDENSSDTHILDLLNNSETEKQSISSNRPTPRSEDLRMQKNENNGIDPEVEGNEFEFDFDQDLIDTFSFLMDQSNPDDFLDYKLDVEDRLDADNMLLPSELEELEEGEIPNS